MVHEPSQLNDVGFDRILRSLGSAAPPQCGVILASGRVRATSTRDILKLCEGRGILMDNFGFWADIGAAPKTAAKSPDSKTHDCRNYVPSAVIGVLVLPFDSCWVAHFAVTWPRTRTLRQSSTPNRYYR